MLKDSVLAFSMANLLFLGVWFDLLDSTRYVREALPQPIEYLSAVVLVTLVGLVLLMVRRWSRRIAHPGLQRVMEGAFALALLFPLNVMRLQFTALKVTLLQGRMNQILMVLAVLCGLALLFLRRRFVVSVAAWVVLIVSPLTPILFAQAIWRWVQGPPTPAMSQPLASTRDGDKQPATRVLWMVFDEMDEGQVFVSRPASVRLPEMDRLRAQSVYAANAFPPAGWTAMSLPALLGGRLVRDAQPLSQSELMITYQGSQTPVPWSKESNIFAAAHAAGFSSGMVGWFHSYCRVLGASLTVCSRPDGMLPLSGAQLDEVMLRQLEQLVPETPVTNYPARRRRRRLYAKILDEALNLVRNRHLSLVLIHWPIPHNVGIYDRSSGRRVLAGSYLDNLELADHTLGEIRKEMEKLGTWDSTHVVVTSDHWWRPTVQNQLPGWLTEEGAAFRKPIDHRVPFLLKMAGQKEGRTIEESFNTVLLHDLTLGLLSGRVTEPDQAVSWIQSHPTAGSGESYVQIGH